MTERVHVATKTSEPKRENSSLKTWNTESPQAMSPPTDQILYLQKAIGNQAIQGLIKQGFWQAKLKIGQPRDKYEQEADREAEAVMRMPEPVVLRQPIEEEAEEQIQTRPVTAQITPLIHRQVEEEEEEELHRQPIEKDKALQVKTASGCIPKVRPDIESYIHSLKGGGRPLSKNERAFFEPRFRQDFSQVRLHTGAKAGEAARAINALAFTMGKDVVFGTGEYETGTNDGRKLLAHELTHVVQQRTHTDSFASEQILQRAAVNYIKQVTGREAEPYLRTFDKTVATIENQISRTTDPVADDIKKALEQLKSLRTRGKITCWRVSGGITYASYDNKTGEIRLHINFGSAASSPVSLIHEAIHALHASRYDSLRRRYADVLAAGGTTNQPLGVLLLKWKAWTEYWAYRRQVEFGNLSQSQGSRRDPHITALHEREVALSIRRVWEVTHIPFDPSKWNPPRQYRTPGLNP